MKRYLLGLFGVCCLLAQGGCGGGSSTSPPPVATHLSVAATSSTVTTGTSLLMTVKALDHTGSVVSSYSGTVNFTSTDALAVLPGFTALSGGTATVQITLKSVGTQTVTVSDVTNVLSASTSGVITVTAGGALAITSGNPPDGTAGWKYSEYRCSSSPVIWCGGFLLQATGGTPPYTWSWASAQPASSTPPGLSIESSGNCPAKPAPTRFFNDWRIVCVPTTAGSYNVAITVTDSTSPSNHVSNNYSINIKNPPPPAINTYPPPSEGAINLPYSFTFTATYGLEPLTWSETGALPPGLDLASNGTFAGTPTLTGSFPIALMVVDSVGQSATQGFTINVAPHGFRVTGSMYAERVSHTATLLQDGKVFVVGGGVTTGFAASTETYDPVARTFAGTATMGSYRAEHTATLLNTGKVLVAGGWNGTGYTDTAEIFDPVGNTFTPTLGKMTTARGGHQATLLNDGKVLITGGETNGTLAPALATAEIYDPDTGMFARTGDMHSARIAHTQTTLKDGTVLVTGGSDSPANITATAEIYDPTSGTFGTPITMATARANHAATLLSSGKILLTGGLTGGVGIDIHGIASAEIFDPSSNTFASTTGSMAAARDLHTATLLNDGTVLVAGGTNGHSLALTELFDPNSETFAGTGSLVTARWSHTGTLLNDGSVLVIGGITRGTHVTDHQTLLSSAETYQ